MLTCGVVSTVNEAKRNRYRDEIRAVALSGEEPRYEPEISGTTIASGTFRVSRPSRSKVRRWVVRDIPGECTMDELVNHGVEDRVLAGSV